MTQLRRGRFEHPFLPVTVADVRARGWNELDILIVSATPTSITRRSGRCSSRRFLEGRGFSVGIIAQPDWHSAEAFAALGRPRLFFGVSAGNMDSMLNHLTAQKKIRNDDQYSPGGRIGLRPDRATIVYAQPRREAFPGVPIVLGGIEASLRRIAHYDYWSRHGPPLDPARRQGRPARLRHGRAADLGDRASGSRRGETIARAARHARHRVPVSRREAERARGRAVEHVADGKSVVLPSYEEVQRRQAASSRSTSRIFHYETNPHNARPLVQRTHDRQAVYLNPPALPLETEADDGRALRPAVHPRAAPDVRRATIPAFETVKHSIVIMRGCFGGCTFCSITEHEGRVIQIRSADERAARGARAARAWTTSRGVVTDLGGPTANMYKMTLQGAKRSSRSAAGSRASTRASARTSAPITGRSSI